jgi:hypothetical protein
MSTPCGDHPATTGPEIDLLRMGMDLRLGWGGIPARSRDAPWVGWEWGESDMVVVSRRDGPPCAARRFPNRYAAGPWLSGWTSPGCGESADPTLDQAARELGCGVGMLDASPTSMLLRLPRLVGLDLRGGSERRQAGEAGSMPLVDAWRRSATAVSVPEAGREGSYRFH